MKKYTTFEALLRPLTTGLLEESITRFDTDYYSKHFKTWDHLVTMIYAQVQEIKSLRDLAIAFNSQQQLNALHCGKVRRSTLSDANRKRSAACFLWIAEKLMTLLPRKMRKDLNKVVRKLDSSPIQLKGQGYDQWTLANRTLRRQGLKLHVEYDGDLAMPVRVDVSNANVDDCRVGQSWPIQADTIYVFDKGYYHFNWWRSIDQAQAFFVTRLKSNAGIKITRQFPVTDEKIVGDDLFEFKHKNSRAGVKNLYNKALRRVVVTREGKKPLVLVTNLLEVPASIIAELYKERWEIELFFKWIKQNLRIKKFLGRSENAVKIQLAAALIAYILIGIFKFALHEKLSFHQFLIWIKYNCRVKKSIYRIIKPPDMCF